MASKAAAVPEKLFECEVKRRRLRQSGNPGYEPFWKVKTVAEALVDGDIEFRCKDCHGAVKLHKRHLATGPSAHVEHKLRADADFCLGAMHFQAATDGRAARLSGTPVH